MARSVDARPTTAAGAAIDGALGDHLGEPRIARELTALLPPTPRSSWPPRCPSATSRPSWRRAQTRRACSPNRGANGIDGTVSAAFGAAAAGDGPVALLIGDVALAHDLGGLLAATRLGISLTIVAGRQRGRRDLRLPAGRRGARRLRGARRHPHRAGSRADRGVVRPRLQRARRHGRVRRGSHRRARLRRDDARYVRTDRKDNVAEHRAVWEAVRNRVVASVLCLMRSSSSPLPPHPRRGRSASRRRGSHAATSWRSTSVAATSTRW